MNYVTPNGKGIKIVPRENKMMFDVVFMKGGEIPEMLKGGFTSVPFAERQIKKYLASKKKNAKSR